MIYVRKDSYNSNLYLESNVDGGLDDLDYLCYLYSPFHMGLQQKNLDNLELKYPLI